MTTTTQEEQITGFDITKKMSLGTIFDGMTQEEIEWKLKKSHKDNDSNVTKKYVAHGYYFGIYIGEYLIIIEDDGYYRIQVLDLEKA